MTHSNTDRLFLVLPFAASREAGDNTLVVFTRDLLFQIPTKILFMIPVEERRYNRLTACWASTTLGPQAPIERMKLWP